MSNFSVTRIDGTTTTVTATTVSEDSGDLAFQDDSGAEVARFAAGDWSDYEEVTPIPADVAPSPTAEPSAAAPPEPAGTPAQVAASADQAAQASTPDVPPMPWPSEPLPTDGQPLAQNVPGGTADPTVGVHPGDQITQQDLDNPAAPDVEDAGEAAPTPPSPV